MPLPRTHFGTDRERREVSLGMEVEYADNINGIVIGVMWVEKSVITHTSFFEGRRVEVAGVREAMDCLSKRINVSRPLYFY